MGLQEPSNRVWLKVGFGKIRKTTKPKDPKAVERKTKDGESTWAVEYNSLTGILEGIQFKDHPEYGRQWAVLVRDGEEQFGLAIKEDGAYGRSLLRMIPNLRAGDIYTFTPYDFVPPNETENKTGLSVKDIMGNKVKSYYQTFQEKNGKTVVENINGFPNYDGDWKDKDEVQIYFTRVNKFLRQAALNHIQSNAFTVAEQKQEKSLDKTDDLPF